MKKGEEYLRMFYPLYRLNREVQTSTSYWFSDLFQCNVFLYYSSGVHGLIVSAEKYYILAAQIAFRRTPVSTPNISKVFFAMSFRYDINTSVMHFLVNTLVSKAKTVPNIA